MELSLFTEFKTHENNILNKQKVMDVISTTYQCTKFIPKIK